MSHHGSCLSQAALLVGDASVWINIIATGHAAQILECFQAKFVVTATAVAELNAGRQKGRATADDLANLVRLGLVEEVELGPEDEAEFLALVAGSTAQTLDDGEAATIAYAVRSGAVALIDERKATTLCQTRYPGLLVQSTVDLLLDDTLAGSLSQSVLRDCVFGALSVARMRVPDKHLEAVAAMLGHRVTDCISLPAAWRSTPVKEILRSSD